MPSLLIVEDERLEREGLLKLIQKNDYGFDEIYTARDGVEGLEAIRAYAPEMIITDVRMPGLSGLEMLKEAGEDIGGSVLIILSGYSEFEYVRAALKAGAVDYLLKPVAEKELSLTIERSFERLAAQQPAREAAEGGVDALPPPLPAEQGEEPLGHTEEYMLNKTIEIIRSEYSDSDLNLRKVAGKLYLSPNYVGALFKRLTGVSFNDYLHQCRLGVAASLLNEPGRKISWIAKRVGIPNTSYFCVLFKAAYGVTPSDYRRKGPAGR